MIEHLFIDTEFNGHNGELLSMAIIDTRGNEFYECLYHKEPLVPWVAKNVKLDKVALTAYEFQEELQGFLGKYTDGFILVADWPDDVKHFMQSIITYPGQMMKIPTFYVVVCREINSEGSAVPHHALHDARAIKAAWFKENP